MSLGVQSHHFEIGLKFSNFFCTFSGPSLTFFCLQRPRPALLCVPHRTASVAKTEASGVAAKISSISCHSDRVTETLRCLPANLLILQHHTSLNRTAPRRPPSFNGALPRSVQSQSLHQVARQQSRVALIHSFNSRPSCPFQLALSLLSPSLPS